MTRSIWFTAIILGVGVPPLQAQAICRQPSAVCADRRWLKADGPSFQQTLVHNGKWLTAAGVAAFSVVAATEHRLSRRDWNSLLTICRSAQDACVVGSDGRYLRPEAEALYQRSREYDRRANRWLVGAQVSLIVTTALFIIDLHPGQGPENIPFPGGLAVTPLPNGAAVGLRIAF
jgi:hypothetical protein